MKSKLGGVTYGRSKSPKKHFAIKLFLTFEKSVLVITYHPHAFEENVNVRSGRDRRVGNDM